MKQSSPASEGPRTGLGDRLLGSRLMLAWALVLAFACVVLWLGTPNFSASRSYSWIARALRFFDPEVEFKTIMWFHHTIRKSMHLIVYAILALLAFRASRLSFGNLLVRAALTALLIALGVAMIDESRQAMHASRTGSPYDVLIDGVGAAAAVGVAGLVLRARLGRRRERSQA